jgi:hypothetical protein
MAGSCFALALALLAWGCAGKAGKAVPLDPATGQHPTNWIQVHYADYAKTPDQCRTCHGSTSDPAQAGGISKVSCFTCHTTGVNHPSNWALPTQHGRLGAQLAPSDDPILMAGFAHCAKCHGADYAGGVSNSSCKACHTKAPHPSKPWTGLGALPSHTATSFLNAPECFKCHAAGANSDLKPLTTPPAGTAPGCFNNTMCHGTSVP